ncbi:hypothetical protein Q0Y04_22380 [Clostridioides difficile]|nr:hypothetical protein Q0Y04_22380 [Clostridioides difficile]
MYAIVNCGFNEGEHNHLAIQMIEHWCKKSTLHGFKVLELELGRCLVH